MSEENKMDNAAKRGRPAKAPEAAPAPGNTIIDLGTPKIVVTKAEPVIEQEAPISAVTKLEMEMGRKALAGSK